MGGGTSDANLVDAAMTALRAGGRLVANAVTLPAEAELIARHGAAGGELVRISVERATPLGTTTAWRPALPVTQWVWVKP
jgi:precorrin-6Y C5,15-methyltransferase (decarboxylating)